MGLLQRGIVMAAAAASWGYGVRAGKELLLQAASDRLGNADGPHGFDDDGLRGGLSGLRWADWDGRKVCRPLAFVLPSSEDELVRTVRENLGQPIKVVGAGHSFSSITLSEGALYVSLDRMRGMVSIDHADGLSSVTVQAGMRLFELNKYLEEAGFSLSNMGATTEQSVAGATATGTHGTGINLGSISTQILALRLVDAKGQVHVASKTQNKDLFDAARVGLGALGIVTQVTLQIEPLFNLRLDTISIEKDTLLDHLPRLLQEFERLQWFYFPGTTKNATLILRQVTEDPISPKGRGCWEQDRSVPFPVQLHAESGGVVVSSCTDVAHKALSDSRSGYAKRTLYTEMEMFVPIEDHVKVMQDFSSLLEDEGLELPSELFLGVRYVAADDIWMSPQHGRANAVVSLIVQGTHSQTGNPDQFHLFSSKLEELAATRYAGVPHWGKENYATRDALEARYSRMDDFNRIRTSLDPEGQFLNPYLTERLTTNRT